jgi:hypothetical protein
MKKQIRTIKLKERNVFSKNKKNKQNQKVNTKDVENNNDDIVVSEDINNTQKNDSKNRSIKLRNHKKQKNQRKIDSEEDKKTESKQVVNEEKAISSKEQVKENKNDSDNTKITKKSRNRSSNVQRKKDKEKPVDIVTSEVKEAQRKRVLNLEGLSVERGLMAPPSELQIQIDSINQLTELSELTDKRKEEMMYSVISPTLHEDKAKKRGWWQKLLKKPEDNKGEK